jgi:hypothetical protein
VFPNPSNGLFFVSVSENLTNTVISLTDIHGQRVLQRQLNTAYEVIDASELAKGMYIVTIQSNKGRAQKKLVIE